MSPPSLDDTDKQSHAAHDHMKVSVTSDTVPNTFSFMRLPADIRLCVYDQLVAMPITRLLVGPRLQVYHAKPSVDILRVSRLVREEAYPIIERGGWARCTLITVKVSGNSSSNDLSRQLYRAGDLMGHIAHRFRVAQKEDALRRSTSNEMHQSTLHRLHQWIEGVFESDWEGATEHRDNKAATFEFFRRAILTLHQGAFNMHIMLHDSDLVLGHPIGGWIYLARTLDSISAACPSPIDEMLQVSVLADCIAHMRNVLNTPCIYGGCLRPEMWRVDVVKDDTQLLGSA